MGVISVLKVKLKLIKYIILVLIILNENILEVWKHILAINFVYSLTSRYLLHIGFLYVNRFLLQEQITFSGIKDPTVVCDIRMCRLIKKDFFNNKRVRILTL